MPRLQILKRRWRGWYLGFCIKLQMKRFLIIIARSYSSSSELPTSINASGVAPHSSAILDVQSTTQDMLVPRLSTSQRSAIPMPRPVGWFL